MLIATFLHGFAFTDIRSRCRVIILYLHNTELSYTRLKLLRIVLGSQCEVMHDENEITSVSAFSFNHDCLTFGCLKLINTMSVLFITKTS